MRKRLKKIEHKIFFAMSIVFCLPIVCLFLYQLIISGPNAVKLREAHLSDDLDHISAHLNSLSRERADIAVNLARRGEFFRQLSQTGSDVTESKPEWDKTIGSEIAKAVEAFPSIIGGGIFYEPFAYDNKDKFRAYHAQWVPPVGLTRKVEFSITNSNPQIDYHNQDWYRTLIPAGWNAKRHLYKDVAWSAPYRDPVTLVPLITVLAAMYSEDSALIGLSSVDWSLDEVTQIIDQSRPTENSIALLFSPGTKTIAAVAGLQGLNLKPIEQVRWMPYLLLNAPQERYEMVPAEDDEGVPFRVYSHSLENGLIYSLIIPESDILAEVKSVSHHFFVILFSATLLGAALLHFFCRRYLGSLSALAQISSQYAAGDYSKKISFSSGDELESISYGLQSIQEYVERLGNQANRLAEGELGEELNPLDLPDPVNQSMVKLRETIVAFTTELELIYGRVIVGETITRIDETQFLGEWRHNARLINQAMTMCDESLREAIAACDAMNNGDIAPRLLNKRRGIFEELRSSIDRTFQKQEKHKRELRLENEGLSLSRDEALLAGRAKTALVGNICEDFQPLLKGVQQNLQHILATSHSKEHEQLLTQTRQAVDTLLTLIEELAGYIHVDDGKVKPECKTFDLYKVLFDTKDLLVAHAMKKRQDFRLVIEENTPPSIIGDAGILEEILLSLISHSIHCTEEEGSILVKVEKTCETDETFTISFTITDTGGALFSRRREAFIRELNDGTREQLLSSGRGGLGILIAQRLIEVMGSSLELDPKFGIGVRYHFSVPFLRPDWQIVDHVPHTAEDAGVFENSAGKVLLIEDNIANQKLAYQLLTKQGYNVTIAGSGEEALSELHYNKFDLILVDLVLPLCDGVETTRLIRTSERSYNSIPIVALTGEGQKNVRDRCVDSGMNGYLPKPLEPKALEDLLDTLETKKQEEKDKKLSAPNPNATK